MSAAGVGDASSDARINPFTTPGVAGDPPPMNPVMEDRAPGLRPISPLTVVLPVLVIVEPAKTAK